MKKRQEYIKSPLNYIGGKYKLLPQIFPLFPEDINTFVDLFCGGLNVGINATANKIIANDTCSEVIDVFKGIKLEGRDNAVRMIEQNIDKFKLSKFDSEGFNNIRDYYNQGNHSWDIFYTMLVFSFNYQIRFNKNREYNMTSGKGRSSFNPRLRGNFDKFSNKLAELDIEFHSKNYLDMNMDNLTKDDFVYIDPPYLISYIVYGADKWNEEKEKELLNYCDSLNDRGIRFALSNVMIHKGETNEILKDWSKKYTVHELNHTYGNSNFQKNTLTKHVTKETMEVLITNY